MLTFMREISAGHCCGGLLGDVHLNCLVDYIKFSKVLSLNASKRPIVFTTP